MERSSVLSCHRRVVVAAVDHVVLSSRCTHRRAIESLVLKVIVLHGCILSFASSSAVPRQRLLECMLMSMSGNELRGNVKSSSEGEAEAKKARARVLKLMA